MLQTVNDKTMLEPAAYDFMKKVAQLYLPAIGSLYFGLAQIWGLAAGDKVVGSIVVIDTFLGVVLGFSAKNYDASGAGYQGEVVLSDKPDGTTLAAMNPTVSPEEFISKDTISLKVVDARDPALQQGNPPSESP